MAQSKEVQMAEERRADAEHRNSVQRPHRHEIDRSVREWLISEKLEFTRERGLEAFWLCSVRRRD